MTFASSSPGSNADPFTVRRPLRDNEDTDSPQGVAAVKLAYFEWFSGVSGDMTLGALLACGADEARFREGLAALALPGYELVVQPVTREGITATDVDVRLLEADRGHGRHLS